ncbi:MAG TPA: MATE family efflux transporter [Terriglobia bacterium]|nr:MATE family efflux transporter [Terriglobia bacterium]
MEATEAAVMTQGQPPPRFWASVREALRGSHQDYTAIGIDRAIFLLAVPMVLEMAMESLFAVVDVFWVARLGANSVATIGLTESLLTLVVAIAMGLGLSTTAMVARRTGEKDPEGAAVAAVQAIALGVGISLVMGLPCLFLAPRLLSVMGATPAIVQVGSAYARIVLSASGVLVLLFLNNAIFRGVGDAAIAMRVLWLSNLINLVLDPCLIFGVGPFPRLGVTGAAVATTTGRSIGLLFQVFMLLRGSDRIRILRRQLRLEVSVMLRLIKVSVAGVVQFLIGQASWIVLVRIISVFGGAAIASYTIAIRIMIFVILPSWGLANAAATLVGQNLGAGEPDRAEQSVWRTGFYNMLFMGTVGVLCIIFAHPMIRVFTNDPAVVPLAVSALRILSFGNIGYAYGMVMLQAFNGAGDTRTPTVVNFFGYWVLEIPLAYALAIRAGFESRGAYLSILIAEMAIAAASMMLFRRGRWKSLRI